MVIGEPANTDAKTSTPWILFTIHELFHHLQHTQPHYGERLQALGLYRGSQTGNWIVNFPFPYDDPGVNARFDRLKELLLQALAEKNGHRFQSLA